MTARVTQLASDTESCNHIICSDYFQKRPPKTYPALKKDVQGLERAAVWEPDGLTTILPVVQTFGLNASGSNKKVLICAEDTGKKAILNSKWDSRSIATFLHSFLAFLKISA